MENTEDTLKFKQAFDYSTTVVCGKCKGSGVRNENTCPLCDGKGEVKRRTHGYMELYSISDEQEIKDELNND